LDPILVALMLKACPLEVAMDQNVSAGS